MPKPDLIGLRKKVGITQQDMAARLGVEQATISRLENGTRRLEWEIAERWLEECGARIEIRSSELNTVSLDGVGVDDASLVRAVIDMLRRPDDRGRRILRALVGAAL